jgi:dienelactone hydrolase
MPDLLALQMVSGASRLRKAPAFEPARSWRGFFGLSICVQIFSVAMASIGLSAKAGERDTEDFARAPAMAMPALSANGRWLAYVEESNQSQVVVLLDLTGDSIRHTIAFGPSRERLRWCGWDSEAFLLCGTAVPRQVAHRAFEETRLYLIEASSGRSRELNRTLRDPLRDRVIDLSPDIPGSVLIEYDEANEGFPTAAELDLHSGHTRTLAKSRAPITRWISDAQHRVRIGVGYERGRVSVWSKAEQGEDWRMLASYDAGDSRAIGPIALNPNGRDMYALAVEDGRIALIEVHLDEPTRNRVLHADPIYDVTGPLIPQPPHSKLEGVRYLRAAETTEYFDPTAAAIQRFLDVELPVRINVRLQRTVDGALELVSSSSAIDPPSLYLLDARVPSLRLLGHQYPELEGMTLSPMRATKYRARDGQVIPAFLTLSSKNVAPMPAIVLPHGGPETRDAVRFDPLVQFLAAQGYAVLQMNFRGSTGYGTAFASTGAGRWGGVVHNDITDGARWLVEQGIADPERMCIVGSSFGGLMALLGAVRESQWYACAASFGGIADLLSLARSNDRSQYAHIWRQRLGEDDRALWENSPLARVRFAETPVLLMHGTLDLVVPVRHSRRMARGLEQAGQSVRFIERADCDHDMTIESCRIAFFSELEAFVAKAFANEGSE